MEQKQHGDRRQALRPECHHESPRSVPARHEPEPQTEHSDQRLTEHQPEAEQEHQCGSVPKR